MGYINELVEKVDFVEEVLGERSRLALLGWLEGVAVGVHVVVDVGFVVMVAVVVLSAGGELSWRDIIIRSEERRRRVGSCMCILVGEGCQLRFRSLEGLWGRWIKE